MTTTRVKRHSDNPAFTAAASLSTPCTLQALRQWIEKLDLMATGEETSSTVTTTSSTIAVS